MRNSKLKSEEIISTIEKLGVRIRERFPNSSLAGVCKDLLELAKESDRIIQWISKPNYFLRFVVILFFLAVFAVLVFSIQQLELEVRKFGLAEFVQMTEAGLNELVLVGAGVFFLITFEVRRKRKRVVAAANRLRCLAHIIDAHQLTKDPDRISKLSAPTENSPRDSLNDFELGRYLDYCTEMLSLTGKIGFLYVQDFDDPIANNAINDLETLTTDMSRKIWQKIMVLRARM